MCYILKKSRKNKLFKQVGVKHIPVPKLIFDIDVLKTKKCWLSHNWIKLTNRVECIDCGYVAQESEHKVIR